MNREAIYINSWRLLGNVASDGKSKQLQPLEIDSNFEGKIFGAKISNPFERRKLLFENFKFFWKIQMNFLQKDFTCSKQAKTRSGSLGRWWCACVVDQALLMSSPFTKVGTPNGHTPCQELSLCILPTSLLVFQCETR